MILTDRQLGILTFINRNQPCAQWEVSEGCNIGMVTAEKWCRELKSLGVITYQNRQDPDNSMPRSVMVTDAGREVLAESYDIIQA